MILNCTHYCKKVKHLPFKQRFEQRNQNLGTNALKNGCHSNVSVINKNCHIKSSHINVRKINEVWWVFIKCF